MKTKKTIWKQLTLRIAPEVHQAIKVKAAEEDRTIAVIVEGLIRQYLVGGKRA